MIKETISMKHFLSSEEQQGLKNLCYFKGYEFYELYAKELETKAELDKWLWALKRETESLKKVTKYIEHRVSPTKAEYNKKTKLEDNIKKVKYQIGIAQKRFGFYRALRRSIRIQSK